MINWIFILSIIEFKFYSLVTFLPSANKPMQHLNKVSDPTFSRKWTFDQNWNTVENTLLRENKQRSEDVELQRSNIQQKINNLTQLQATKISVMNDNLKYQKSQSTTLQRSTADTIDKAKDYGSEYQSRCMDFATDYLNNAQTFTDKILAYSRNKVIDVEKRLNNVDQSIRRKTEEEMRELRESSIQHIKKILVTETANQKAQIQTLSNLVGNSLKSMRETLRAYEKQTLKSQGQLEEKIDRLDQQMYALISAQTKQGDMTYDCLLKLVQDSCGKIEYLKLR